MNKISLIMPLKLYTETTNSYVLDYLNV